MKKAMLLVLLSITLSACRIQSGSDGRQTGYVEAVQRNGVIWKNYRVFIKSSIDASTSDIYCMNESESDLADKLFQSQEKNQRVTIQYTKYSNFFSFSECDGDEITNFYIVEEVK